MGLVAENNYVSPQFLPHSLAMCIGVLVLYQNFDPRRKLFWDLEEIEQTHADNTWYVTYIEPKQITSTEIHVQNSIGISDPVIYLRNYDHL